MQQWDARALPQEKQNAVFSSRSQLPVPQALHAKLSTLLIKIFYHYGLLKSMTYLLIVRKGEKYRKFVENHTENIKTTCIFNYNMI